jgi:hypothetical protein
MTGHKICTVVSVFSVTLALRHIEEVVKHVRRRCGSKGAEQMSEIPRWTCFGFLTLVVIALLASHCCVEMMCFSYGLVGSIPLFLALEWIVDSLVEEQVRVSFST